MTKHEAAVLSTFTGILIGSFSDMHEYMEKIYKGPIFTHQLGNKEFVAELKELSRPDFMLINELIK